MPVVEIKGVGKAQFPDDMPLENIRSFLRNKYSQQAMQGQSDLLAPQPQTATPYEPTLAEKFGTKIAEGLKSTGLISDNYGAQRIGRNVTALGEFLPGVGDATAGDEFGRAASDGDLSGMAMAGLGVIPVAGDALKRGVKAIDYNPIDEIIKFSDKVAARREAKMSVYGMPTKGKAENIKHITDLTDYTPEQLVSQLKTLDNKGIRQGGYLKKGDGLDVFYKDDGTSQMIEPSSGDVIFDSDVEQTARLAKDDILNLAENTKTPEQKKAEFEARNSERKAQRAREEAEKESYKMQHTAPMRGENPTMDDLTQVYGDDIYTGNAVRYYGSGADYDQKAVNIIQAMKGKPEKPVMIYRAVPKDIKEINSSDWVTTTKEYAKDHMKGEKGWHILSKKVKAKDIASDGNSLHEFGYDPQ